MANFKNFKSNLRRLAEDYMTEDADDLINEDYPFDEFEEKHRPVKDRQVSVEEANNIEKGK